MVLYKNAHFCFWKVQMDMVVTGIATRTRRGLVLVNTRLQRVPIWRSILAPLRHLATDISLLTNERRLYVCYGIRLTASALWLSIPLGGSSLHFLTHVRYYSTNKIKFLQCLIREWWWTSLYQSLQKLKFLKKFITTQSFASHKIESQPPKLARIWRQFT